MVAGSSTYLLSATSQMLVIFSPVAVKDKQHAFLAYFQFCGKRLGILPFFFQWARRHNFNTVLCFNSCFTFLIFNQDHSFPDLNQVFQLSKHRHKNLKSGQTQTMTVINCRFVHYEYYVDTIVLPHLDSSKIADEDDENCFKCLQAFPEKTLA